MPSVLENYLFNGEVIHVDRGEEGLVFSMAVRGKVVRRNKQELGENVYEFLFVIMALQLVLLLHQVQSVNSHTPPDRATHHRQIVSIPRE